MSDSRAKSEVREKLELIIKNLSKRIGSRAVLKYKYIYSKHPPNSKHRDGWRAFRSHLGTGHMEV